MAMVTEQQQDRNGVGADGFIKLMFSTTHDETGCTFRHSPIGVSKVFLNKVHRDSQGIGKIHMGRMLDALLLTEEEFAD